MNAPATERAPGLDDVLAARERIGRHVRRTPLERSAFLSEACGVDVLLKLECWQRTRSFKVRGAFNAVALLTADERSAGVVTASAGNHGQAVALAAAEYGVRATIFVPADAPQVKQQRIRQLGAQLDNDATDYDEAEQLAQQHAAAHGLRFIHPYSELAVMSGQGTVALEILEDAPDVREVVVPVGGGGLAAGTGAVLRARSPHVRLLGVQSVETRAMYEAFQAGHVVDVPVTPTLADGLAGCTDDNAFRAVRAVLDDLVLVGETEIGEAIRLLYQRDGVVAEGAAAVVAAALLSGRVSPAGTTALVVSGGNIDGARLARILSPSLS